MDWSSAITSLVSYKMGLGERYRLLGIDHQRECMGAVKGDIVLPAGVDDAHETLSGPATKKLLEPACYNFNHRR